MFYYSAFAAWRIAPGQSFTHSISVSNCGRPRNWGQVQPTPEVAKPHVVFHPGPQASVASFSECQVLVWFCLEFFFFPGHVYLEEASPEIV